jgi:hypothetical protein
MTTPATSLDHRFSDPDAAATGWDETRRALEAAELFWITTVRADGVRQRGFQSHVAPVLVELDECRSFPRLKPPAS